jgi:hypothetical protein
MQWREAPRQRRSEHSSRGAGVERMERLLEFHRRLEGCCTVRSVPHRAKARSGGQGTGGSSTQGGRRAWRVDGGRSSARGAVPGGAAASGEATIWAQEDEERGGKELKEGGGGVAPAMVPAAGNPPAAMAAGRRRGEN